MTTIETVTRQQIRQLRVEAAAAGDHLQVSLCDKALEHDAVAIAACVEAIREAEAQRE